MVKSTVRQLPATTSHRPPLIRFLMRSNTIEALTLLLFGVLLWMYRWRGKLFLLIHPNYMVLAVIAGACLIGLGSYRLVQLWRSQGSLDGAPEHPSLFHPRVGILLMLTIVLLGFVVTPRPLSSQTALNRGVAQNLGITRNQPQAFRPQLDPRQRSLIDWVRTLEVYPDPIHYEGQPVEVEGFVIHPDPDATDTFMIAKFLISCCAADAYPVGLPVVWSQAAALKADSWQRIQGSMQVRSTDGQPELVIQAEQVDPIPTPINPYGD